MPKLREFFGPQVDAERICREAVVATGVCVAVSLQKLRHSFLGISPLVSRFAEILFAGLSSPELITLEHARRSKPANHS